MNGISNYELYGFRILIGFKSVFTVSNHLFYGYLLKLKDLNSKADPDPQKRLVLEGKLIPYCQYRALGQKQDFLVQ
jgi:hypothetical protein